MDDILLKRNLVKSRYPGKEWDKKVDKMSDAQVIAVYMRLKAQNQI